MVSICEINVEYFGSRVGLGEVIFIGEFPGWEEYLDFLSVGRLLHILYRLICNLWKKKGLAGISMREADAAHYVAHVAQKWLGNKLWLGGM